MVLKQLFGKKNETGRTSLQVAPMDELKIPEAKEAPEAVRAGASSKEDEPSPALYLEQAMIENARNDNPETRRKVYQELLFSDLLLALAEPAEGAEGADANTSQDPSQINVAILTNSANMQFASAFTSAAAARRWRAEGGHYVGVRGQDIFKLLEPSPAEVIVINPGSAPFIVLPKVEYRQLALGIVPQTNQSPVQVSTGEQNAPASGEAEADNSQMQVAFPPNVFSDDQKDFASKIMSEYESVQAAVLGAILPPGAEKDAWVRTIFLRVEGVEESQDAMKSLCGKVRDALIENTEIFKDTGFEVGVMPDPNFWIAMHQNNIVLFDKNPPALPPPGAADTNA